MENKQSSDGLAEDLIRAFVQIGCAESHAKTLLEKASGELEDGLIDTGDQDIVQEQILLIDDITSEINNLAGLRRDMMRYLQSLYPDGNKDYWCMVKHLGVGAYTAFEVYQASDDDVELLKIALYANRRFINALSHFLGIEIVECASCFADALKGVKDE